MGATLHDKTSAFLIDCVHGFLVEKKVKAQTLYERSWEEASLNEVQERAKKWNKDMSCQRGVDSNETPNNMTAQTIFQQ